MSLKTEQKLAKIIEMLIKHQNFIYTDEGGTYAVFIEGKYRPGYRDSTGYTPAFGGNFVIKNDEIHYYKIVREIDEIRYLNYKGLSFVEAMKAVLSGKEVEFSNTRNPGKILYLDGGVYSENVLSGEWKDFEFDESIDYNRFYDWSGNPDSMADREKIREKKSEDRKRQTHPPGESSHRPSSPPRRPPSPPRRPPSPPRSAPRPIRPIINIQINYTTKDGNKQSLTTEYTGDFSEDKKKYRKYAVKLHPDTNANSDEPMKALNTHWDKFYTVRGGRARKSHKKSYRNRKSKTSKTMRKK